MTIQIHRFLNKIKSAEARNERLLSMTLAEAKELHYELTLVLLNNEALRAEIQLTQSEAQEIAMSGGSFKSD